jgi:hypothetical protein
VTGDDHFLSRWSRRKHAVRKGEVPPPGPDQPVAGAVPAVIPTSGAPAETESEPEPLPPVESLTPESDFSPFMRKDVEPGLRRAALKTLFRDPRFNVMDGLDVYIDDFSKPDPIPPDWLGKLNQMAHLGDFRVSEAKSEAEGEPLVEGEADEVVAANQQVEVVPSPPEEGASEPESPAPESKHS